jgi:membrane protease YdiL (CAAX protease family)
MATMPPPVARIPFRHLLVIILAQTFALMIQAWLSRTLLAQGYEKPQAHYLAYLVVPPTLLLMLLPVLSEHRDFLTQLFRRNALTIRLALAAVALGVTMRAIWWSQLIARISLGITVNDDPQAIAGPAYTWACPPLPALLLGVLVMAVLIPVMEETIHRGVIQSAFVNKGPVAAILASSIVFTAFHPPSSFVWVFIMGLVMGAQFWLTGTLWASMITHATYNGLVQLDWRCLRGQWNPPADSLPQLLPGTVALTVLVIASLLVFGLLRWQRAGAPGTPAPAANPPRSRHAR